MPQPEKRRVTPITAFRRWETFAHKQVEQEAKRRAAQLVKQLQQSAPRSFKRWVRSSAGRNALSALIRRGGFYELPAHGPHLPPIAQPHEKDSLDEQDVRELDRAWKGLGLRARVVSSTLRGHFCLQLRTSGNLF